MLKTRRNQQTLKSTSTGPSLWPLGSGFLRTDRQVKKEWGECVCSTWTPGERNNARNTGLYLHRETHRKDTKETNKHVISEWGQGEWDGWGLRRGQDWPPGISEKSLWGLNTVNLLPIQVFFFFFWKSRAPPTTWKPFRERDKKW